MTQPLPDQRIAEITQRLDAATPGPWRWHHNGGGPGRQQDYKLMTTGWDIVMDFVRQGMQSAQPRFNIKGLMEKATDLPAPAPRLGIGHPDADFIAHAREDLEDLLIEVHRLRRAITEGTQP